MTDFFNFFGDLAEGLINTWNNFIHGMIQLYNFTLGGLTAIQDFTAYLPSVVALGITTTFTILTLKFVLGR